MVEKRVARHRAACSPSTPFSVALNKIRHTNGGKRVLAVAGTGAVLTAVAAAIPAEAKTNEATSASVNAAEVISNLVDRVSINNPVTTEKASFAETAAVSVKVSGETLRSRPVASSQPQVVSAVDLSQLPPADSNIVGVAYKYIGTRYVWGGRTPAGFDCSGFVSYVYGQIGKNIPAHDRAIANAGKRIPLSALQPGDVVWRPGHVGIYVGNGQVIQAYLPGKPLGISPIRSGGFISGVRF